MPLYWGKLVVRLLTHQIPVDHHVDAPGVDTTGIGACFAGFSKMAAGQGLTECD